MQQGALRQCRPLTVWEKIKGSTASRGFRARKKGKMQATHSSWVWTRDATMCCVQSHGQKGVQRRLSSVAVRGSKESVAMSHGRV